MDSTNNKQKDSSKFILFSVILVTILVIIVISLSFVVFKGADSSGGQGDYNQDGSSGIGESGGSNSGSGGSKNNGSFENSSGGGSSENGKNGENNSGSSGSGESSSKGGGNGNNGDKNFTNISMTYTEDTNGISLQDALPMSDSVGKVLSGKGEYFDFTIRTNVSQKTPVSYEIAVIKDKKSTINENDIKLYLEKQVSGSYEQVTKPTIFKPIQKTSEIGSPKNSMILYKVKRKNKGTDNYRLRMWLKEDADIQPNQFFTVKVNIYGKAF